MARVLFIDDSPVFTSEAVEYFQKLKWHAEAAGDGVAGMRLLRERHFDAVVLDRNMPGCSGDEVLRWIRKQNPLQDLCVVILTGYGDTESAIDALKLGAFQYLQKPIREFTPLRSILAAGIAWHKTHALRRDLLASFGRETLFHSIRKILTDTMDADGVHAIFMDNDGRIETVLGAPVEETAGPCPLFVRRILAGEPYIFEQEAVLVAPLQPIIRDARTLMAVPVQDAKGPVGVLDMESRDERAFDSCWREVLNYMSDLIGISLYVNQQANDVAAQRSAADRRKAEFERLDVVYREFRHSIANPAQIISMQARELEADLKKPPTERDERKIRDRLGFILANVGIVETTMQDLKDMSSPPGELALERIDLADLIQGCTEQLGGEEFEKQHKIKFDVPPPEPILLRADRYKLRYSLDCLLRNAIEAVEAERQARREQSADGLGRISVEVKPTPREVKISVTDRGIGFDPSQMDTIFQPLYSTKSAGEHRGIGLYSVRRLIGQHGGAVEARSPGPHQGATFEITLPRGL